MKLISACLLALAATPAFAAPDEDLLGKAQAYPIGTRANWFYDESVRIGSFSNVDRILRVRKIERADTPSPLKKAATEPDLRYGYDGKSLSIDDYLQRQRVTGLLIIKDGEILVERYQYDRKPTDKFVSHSMAKSIASLAVGLAREEGKIKSLEDKVARYVPDLAGYPYGEASIRDILHMSSGVKFTENYSGDDDLKRFVVIAAKDGLIEALKAFRDMDGKAGERFHYASSETYILGLVVRNATGKTLADYVAEKLWQPMGTEADASWAIDKDGIEMTAGNFNAVLRDYGRLGMLLANDGALNGKQILPKDYLLEATDSHKQPAAFVPGAATPLFGYGLHFWLLPGEKRRFLMMGVYGQAIYVDPEAKLVMVQTAAAKNASVFKEKLGMETYTLWTSLVYALGKK
ncbi:MAG: serine hydrolase [Burkholderiales bacterium]|nr:serine hydrolase [Burkholderiales bacterium]